MLRVFFKHTILEKLLFVSSRLPYCCCVPFLVVVTPVSSEFLEVVPVPLFNIVIANKYGEFFAYVVFLCQHIVRPPLKLPKMSQFLPLFLGEFNSSVKGRSFDVHFF